jgi:multiple sugar transport system substrate-binding protein
MRCAKLTASLLTGVLALAVAGCGADDDTGLGDPSAVTGTVTAWVYPLLGDQENAWWQQRVAEFRKQYTKVDVSVVVQPWANRDTQLTTAIAGGKGPDVVYLNADQIPQYAVQGALADVSGVLDDRADFRPNALSAMTYKDTLYAAPVLMSVTTTLVNRKVLQAAGVTDPPKTWDDLRALAPKLKDKGLYATQIYGVPTSLNATYYPYLWQAGGQVLSADGKKSAFNSAAGVKALRFLKELTDAGAVPKDSLTTLPTSEADPFAQGKVAVQFPGDPATVRAFKSGAADYQVAAPLADVKSVSFGSVAGLAVLDSAKDKAAAKAWVKFMASPDPAKAFVKDRGYFAPRKSAGTLYAGDPLSGAAERYLDAMEPGVLSPQARQISDLVKPHVQAVLLGRATPEQALADAAKEVDALLARG